MAKAATKRPAQPAHVRLLPTPEGVNLSLEMASVGSRLSAFMVDILIIGGTMFAITMILISAGISMASGSLANEQSLSLLAVLWLFTIFVLRNFWFILFEMGPRGATPGKRLLGLRVIARGGGRLEASSVVARNLLRDVETFLPLGFLIQQLDAGTIDAWTGLLGFGWTMLFMLFPLFNRDRLRAGDLLAGTWVIRAEQRKAGQDLLDGRADDPQRYQFTEAQLAAYGNFELQTLERVLRDDSNQSLSLVAETIRQKIGWPYEYDDRAFLSAYYAAVRARLEKGLLFGKRKVDKYDGGA
ncbi:MAG: RDD family protein [Sphingomonadaceae bacterium]